MGVLCIPSRPKLYVEASTERKSPGSGRPSAAILRSMRSSELSCIEPPIRKIQIFPLCTPISLVSSDRLSSTSSDQGTPSPPSSTAFRSRRVRSIISITAHVSLDQRTVPPKPKKQKAGVAPTVAQDQQGAAFDLDSILADVRDAPAIDAWGTSGRRLGGDSPPPDGMDVDGEDAQPNRDALETTQELVGFDVRSALFCFAAHEMSTDVVQDPIGDFERVIENREGGRQEEALEERAFSFPTYRERLKLIAPQWPAPATRSSNTQSALQRIEKSSPSCKNVETKR